MLAACAHVIVYQQCIQYVLTATPRICSSTATSVADCLSWVYAESDKNNKQKKDLSRRSSSGNWIEDRVTWKEELNYKKAMGYM